MLWFLPLLALAVLPLAAGSAYGHHAMDHTCYLPGQSDYDVAICLEDKINECANLYSAPLHAMYIHLEMCGITEAAPYLAGMLPQGAADRYVIEAELRGEDGYRNGMPLHLACPADRLYPQECSEGWNGAQLDAQAGHDEFPVLVAVALSVGALAAACLSWRRR